MSDRRDPLLAILTQRARDRLRFIRDTMAVAATFTEVPGRGGVASRQPTAKRWLVAWLIAAARAEGLVGGAVEEIAAGETWR